MFRGITNETADYLGIFAFIGEKIFKPTECLLGHFIFIEPIEVEKIDDIVEDINQVSTETKDDFIF